MTVIKWQREAYRRFLTPQELRAYREDEERGVLADVVPLGREDRLPTGVQRLAADWIIRMCVGVSASHNTPQSAYLLQ